MAINDGYLRGVPSDANPNDGRLYDPTTPDSGGTTLSPSEGAITLAGQVCSITLILAVAAGAITLGGSAPAIASSYAPTTGSVVIAGNAPAMSGILAPATGALAIGGNAPSLASILSPAAGAIIVAGNVPAIASGFSPAEGAISIDGGAPDIVIIVPPDTATATPGRGLWQGVWTEFRGLKSYESEDEKLVRRIREGTVQKPAVPLQPIRPDIAAEYEEKSARLAAAIARFRAESQLHREAIAVLEEALRRRETDKLHREHLLAQQALLLAQVQEAALLEEMEILDIAFLAVIALWNLQ